MELETDEQMANQHGIQAMRDSIQILKNANLKIWL